ncbi:hypothetical protein ACIQI7_13280 [Kitasatospora sp. NPDC092039]|uniref:hypothetical protein n=1 Tax=Kitasatospora sp. NPDC092039 TaxID=3364086 RepID=UPI00382F514F
MVLLGPLGDVAQSSAEWNARWRIDLQVATPALAAKAVGAHVERAAAHAERWSDHAPVIAPPGDGQRHPQG